MGALRSRPVLIVLLLLGLTLLSVGAPIAARAAGQSGGEVAWQVSTPVPGGFCGDGICDEYSGENAANCAVDCAPPATPGPTDTPVTVEDTATPVPTRVPSATPAPARTVTVTITATATSTATATRPPTSTPTGTITATATPTGLPTYTPTVDVIRPPGCALVSYESRPDSWKQAYAAIAVSSYKVPVRLDDQEVYVCEMPPVGRLCFLLYDGLLDAAQGNTDRIQLVDCSEESCTALAKLGQKVGDQFCFDIASDDNITCELGCAMALLPPGQTAAGKPARKISPIVFVTLGCLLAALILILVLFLLSRRRRSTGEDAEEADEVVQAGP